jgi:RNA polymerase sigma factor (sigma-70 family)
MSIGEAFDSVLSAAHADAGWAYERLYQDLAPAVLGYVRLQGSKEPEDLTSEVFLGAFARLPSFRGNEEQFRSWVFTIAYRRLVDERRRGSCRPATDPSTHDGWDREGGDVEADALCRLGQQRVFELCQAVSPAQRDVLLLRMIAGMTLEQVAGLLGKSTGAIKALQCRGLLTVRALLERQIDHPLGKECVTL